MNCVCDNFKKATEANTDAEGFGPLINTGDGVFYTEYDRWYMGNGSLLPPMIFCPWCGAGVPPTMIPITLEKR